MSTVDDKTPTGVTTAGDMQALVKEVAALLRARPVAGSDPEQAQQWLRRVVEFLHSARVLAVLAGLGIQPPDDFGPQMPDQSPVLDHIAESLDDHEDNPLLLVAAAVEVAYIALVGYAIYSYVTQPSQPAQR
jgi:hypothetical protein